MLLKMKSVSNFCCNTISYILIYSVAINCFFSEEELPVCLPAKSTQCCGIVCRCASVVLDSLRPCGLKASRLLCPWDYPGKITGEGYNNLEGRELE